MNASLKRIKPYHIDVLLYVLVTYVGVMVTSYPIIATYDSHSPLSYVDVVGSRYEAELFHINMYDRITSMM